MTVEGQPASSTPVREPEPPGWLYSSTERRIRRLIESTTAEATRSRYDSLSETLSSSATFSAAETTALFSTKMELAVAPSRPLNELPTDLAESFKEAFDLFDRENNGGAFHESFTVYLFSALNSSASSRPAL